MSASFPAQVRRIASGLLSQTLLLDRGQNGLFDLEQGKLGRACANMPANELGKALQTTGGKPMKRQSRTIGAMFAGAALLSVAGCQQKADDSSATAGNVKLPISINAAMVGTVSHSADYIFALSNGDMPKDDHDWDLVRAAAYETILGGTVIQIEGTGPRDGVWVADPEWKGYAEQLTAIGEEALKLVEEKSTDKAKWESIGNNLVDDCQACHQKFKPEIPSEGILHGSTERESRGVSIFD